MRLNHFWWPWYATATIHKQLHRYNQVTQLQNKKMQARHLRAKKCNESPVQCNIPVVVKSYETSTILMQICDRIWENVHSSHIWFCSFRDLYKLCIYRNWYTEIVKLSEIIKAQWSEYFTSIYHFRYIIWVTKDEKLDVWTMPKSSHICSLHNILTNFENLMWSFCSLILYNCSVTWKMWKSCNMLSIA